MFIVFDDEKSMGTGLDVLRYSQKPLLTKMYALYVLDETIIFGKVPLISFMLHIICFKYSLVTYARIGS